MCIEMDSNTVWLVFTTVVKMASKYVCKVLHCGIMKTHFNEAGTQESMA